MKKIPEINIKIIWFLLLASLVTNVYAGNGCEDGDFDQELVSRLEKKSESVEGLKTVRHSATPFPPDNPYEVEIESSDRLAEGRSKIYSKLTEDEWKIFDVKKNNNNKKFFASDMFRDQVLKSKQDYQFPKRLPNKITFKYVTNTDTLKALNGIEPGTYNFTDTFLDETPLGKMTSKITEDFGLEVTDVTTTDGQAIDTGVDNKDINIQAKVRPVDPAEAYIKSLYGLVDAISP